MWTHPGIDLFDELDSRAGLEPAHLIKWNPFLDEAAAVHELESCEDLVIGVLDHFLENKPSPYLHASTSLGPLPHFITGRPLRVRVGGEPVDSTLSLPQHPDSTARSVRSSSQSISNSAKVRVFGFPQNSPIR
jgi:hypothetical protein